MGSVYSPCIRNCCLSQEDICLGCFRSLDEILCWGAATDQKKQQILNVIKIRKQDYQDKHPDLPLKN